ncbi:sigma-54-dependent transcriptional regulator [Photobacterium lutimaris]|uniref:DNA-binding response regulator n=1 Tax=Photobacterium lutimaris TaxID=388278 RepID=A0A2T3IYB8_9GAMM|nr:sigma-54 dependent transcriptional regulator [Photobacterium lutimaris]PSU33594.1 DNA-binding response regulator [Photobacterium lutimaris]TDR74561.1 two-component system C4-dicarboxylate transport response regulator DctD [Photobacterium lutimaris]
MNTPVIFIDDEKSVRHALGQTLELEDYDVTLFASAKPALDQLANQFQGVIISDINMPGMDGLTFLKQALTLDPEFSIIMLTGHGDISMAVEAMRLGAYDFLEKPFSTEHLLDVVKRAAEKRELVLENRELRRELEVQSGPGPRILGNDPSIKQLRRILSHQSKTHAPLFIHGPSGCGKALVARFVHDHGLQPQQPFITIDCSAPGAEAQLGELIGNHTDQPYGCGAQPSPHFATLYLKHINLTPQQVHPALEAFIETLCKGNESVRVIVSADTDYHRQSQAGLLHSLYFKLGFITLDLPPLHKRRDDIALLFHNFLRTDCSRFGIEPPHIDARLEQWLTEQDWPGNVRELRQFAERYALLGSKAIGTQDQHGSDQSPTATLAIRVADFECKVLHDALNRHQGRLKEVQLELGLARKTLYDKLRKYHIDKKEFKA